MILVYKNTEIVPGERLNSCVSFFPQLWRKACFLLFRPGILETSCLSHQDNLHLGKLHARCPRDECGCTDPVDAGPRNLPNYFQNQPGPRKLGFLEMHAPVTQRKPGRPSQNRFCWRVDNLLNILASWEPLTLPSG